MSNAKLIIDTIRLKNFFLVGNDWLTFDFTGRNVLFKGENGAGKSTLIDALCFVFFGKAYRRITQKDIPNRHNAKDCLVECSFRVAGDVYHIRRGIKPNIFEVTKNGEEFLHERDANERQKMLENLIGCDYDTFSQYVVFGWAKYKPFLEMTPQQRRDVVDNLLNLGEYYEMKGKVADAIKLKSSKLSDINVQMKVKESLISSLRSRLGDAQRYNDNIQIEIDLHNSKIEVANAEILNAEEMLAEVSVPTETKEALTEKYQKLKSAIDVGTSKARDITNDVIASGVCVSCKQEVSEEYSKTQNETLKQKADTILQHVEKAKGALDVVVKLIEDFRHYEDANRLLNDRKNILKRLSEHRLIDKIDVKPLEDEMATHVNDLETFKTSYETVENEVRLLKIIQENASDNGVIADIISAFIPRINEKVNDYITKFGFDVVFEMDETFNETIYNGPFETNYHSYSIGERLRLNLPLIFAWKEIAAEQATVSTNLTIWDEILNSSVDGVGQHLLLNMITAREDDGCVIVISHGSDDMEHYFDDVYTYKKGAFTEVSHHSP